MKRLFLILCMVVSLCGCALFAGELDKAAEGAGKLVTIREQFRAAVNQHAAPHSVSVACAQGGQPLIVQPEGAPPPPVSVP